MKYKAGNIFWDSFFYFHGLVENPFEEDAMSVLKEQPSLKIKKDISKVNNSLKETLNLIKQKSLEVEF